MRRSSSQSAALVLQRNRQAMKRLVKNAPAQSGRVHMRDAIEVRDRNEEEGE